jgi:hypothetical protein
MTTNGDRPAAGDPVVDWTQWENVYSAHDGLEPDELDIEVEFEEEWRDRWTTEDKRGVALVVALIVVAIVCYRLGELSALGWFQ